MSSLTRIQGAAAAAGYVSAAVAGTQKTGQNRHPVLSPNAACFPTHDVPPTGPNAQCVVPPPPFGSTAGVRVSRLRPSGLRRACGPHPRRSSRRLEIPTKIRTKSRTKTQGRLRAGCSCHEWRVPHGLPWRARLTYDSVLYTRSARQVSMNPAARATSVSACSRSNVAFAL